jgi:hypothetical protein
MYAILHFEKVIIPFDKGAFSWKCYLVWSTRTILYEHSFNVNTTFKNLTSSISTFPYGATPGGVAACKKQRKDDTIIDVWIPTYSFSSNDILDDWQDYDSLDVEYLFEFIMTVLSLDNDEDHHAFLLTVPLPNSEQSVNSEYVPFSWTEGPNSLFGRLKEFLEEFSFQQELSMDIEVTEHEVWPVESQLPLRSSYHLPHQVMWGFTVPDELVVLIDWSNKKKWCS